MPGHLLSLALTAGRASSVRGGHRSAALQRWAARDWEAVRAFDGAWQHCALFCEQRFAFVDGTCLGGAADADVVGSHKHPEDIIIYLIRRGGERA